MLKATYVIEHGGFGQILKEKLNLVGISGKLKSLIEYIQWKRLESNIVNEPQEIKSKLSPCIQECLQNLQYHQIRSK